MRPHEEFRGEIAGDLAIQIEIGLGCAHPALLHAVAHRQCKRAVIVVRTRDGGQTPEGIAQVIDDGLP